jgi:hypothetical protein
MGHVTGQEIDAEIVVPFVSLGDPVEPVLDPDDPKTKLRARLLTVLLGLPAYFDFDNHIAGVEATDLHSLNTLLGASIEGQVVKALNLQRKIWDPDDEWQGHRFVRQSQRFPDVLLVSNGGAGGQNIALGIELKGWFLLAKERKPSFRFQTTPDACAPHDLLVVVPWYLDNVLSGSPVAAEPWVVSSKWAAQFRNHYWQHLRGTAEGSNVEIVSPASALPYPTKAEVTLDHAVDDSGHNFGRVARTPGIMEDFIQTSNDLEVLGIRIGDWNTFLRGHSDQVDLDEVSDKLLKDLRAALGRKEAARAPEIVAAVQALVAAWGALL